MQRRTFAKRRIKFRELELASPSEKSDLLVHLPLSKEKPFLHATVQPVVYTCFERSAFLHFWSQKEPLYPGLQFWICGLISVVNAIDAKIKYFFSKHTRTSSCPKCSKVGYARLRTVASMYFARVMSPTYTHMIQEAPSETCK